MKIKWRWKHDASLWTKIIQSLQMVCPREQAYRSAWKKEKTTAAWWALTPLSLANMASGPSAHAYCTRALPAYRERNCLLGQDFHCGLSLAIREKFPFKYHHLIVAIQTDKNKQSLVWRGRGENALRYTAGGNENRHNPWKMVW